jgi:hypothetical protein
MALRISWSSRGGARLSESVKIGRLRIGESIPIGKSKNGRKRRTRRWISFRL